MSGSTIGGIVGGTIGFFFGVPQLGYVLGSAIGGAIDPDEIRGPSIGDAQRQTTQAGIPRPVVYGHPAPFMGNIIDGEQVARTVEQTEGGKGGPEVTTERFLLTSAIRICEGPIAGVLRIWRNDQIVFDRTADGNFPEWTGGDSVARQAYIAALRAKTSAFNNSVAIYFGTEDQLPDPTLEALHGIGNTPYYRGTAYMVIRDDDVTDMRGAAAQWKFEVLQVATDGPDATVVPNDDFVPFYSRDGGMSPGIEVFNDSLSGNLPPITQAPLVMVVAALVPQYTEAQAYAPSMGQFPVGNGYCPSRIVLKTSTGGVIFDSGWMGYPIQQTDLNIALQLSGMGTATIVPATEVSEVVTMLSSNQNLTITQYNAGFPAQSPTTTVVAGSRIELLYPDIDLLPDRVVVTPELPGALLGSDGNIYWPEWATPTSVPTLTPEDVLLSDVVLDIAGRCRVTADRIDVAEIAATTIPGFLVAQQGSGVDCLIPTQRGFFYDFPEFDGELRAVLRGAAAVVSLTEDDFIDGDDEQTRPQQVEFPRLVSVVTQDPAANYAPVPQTSIRTSLEVEATSEVQLPLAIPFGADASKQIAEKLHKVLWAQAEGRQVFSLPEQFSVLTPSDCFTYAGRRWLIEKTDYADGEMVVQAAYDRASAYNSNATGQPATPPGLPPNGLAGPTLFAWMNISLLSDLDDRLGFYVAVSGVSDGWPGAQIEVSPDDGVTWTVMGTVTQRSIMGSLVTALPNATFATIDTLNTVRVEVNGTLSSITELQLLNEGNPCVIGEEICQFQTATFISDNVYDLSILTRGRLDSQTAAHVIGERFVFLNAPQFFEAPSSWIGRSLQVRAVTVGTPRDNAPIVSVMWSPARSQTEWAPVQFTGVRDTSNNITLGWVGRGRLGNNANPINSSFFDGYRITITKGSASVVYTTTAVAFIYTAAQQTADFGSATGTLTIAIAAMNRITGASVELTGSVP